MKFLARFWFMCDPHFCPVNITGKIRNCAAEPSIAREEALEHASAAKLKEFVEKGPEICAKA